MREYNEIKNAKLDFEPLFQKHIKLYFDNMIYEIKIMWNSGSLRSLILSYGTFCFQIGISVHHWAVLSKTLNLVAFLCLGAFF